MPIVFEKRLTQEYFSNICDARRNISADHKYNLKDYQLTPTDCVALIPMAKKDAMGFYYNALVSFSQACHSLQAGCVSWACVELYYSLFYATRANLYYKDYLLIRDRALYLVKIAVGEHPEYKKGNKAYNTDHSGSLNYFIDKFQNSDFLCSNSIVTDNVYLWMMDLRETTNYRNKHFKEPDSFTELLPLFTRIKNEGISKILDEFRTDFGTYCFSENHAWLCVPFYKILEVAALYKAESEKLSNDEEDYIKTSMNTIGLSTTIIGDFI